VPGGRREFDHGIIDLVPRSLTTLFKELIDGPAPDAAYMLNPGDGGLLRSLAALSAEAASRTPANGGATVAAHVDHLIYGLTLMNDWSRGNPDPWSSADWSASWRRGVVDEEAWRTRRESLESEARAWIGMLRTPREYTEIELTGLIATVGHLAYHVGAIRQIERATRGPLASESP